MTDSNAYQYVKKIVQERAMHIIHREVVKRIEHPKPRSVQEVSKMFDNLLSSQTADTSSTSQSPLHEKIEELIEPIKPYILGSTPMCKAMKDAEAVFVRTSVETAKVLFILSDGMSSDGDPRQIAERLRDLGVTIVTCLLTSDKILNPRRLLPPNYKFQHLHQCKGKKYLFNMSSTQHNTDVPVTYLADANWELPAAGESRLFIEANSLDVVNEFCEIAVSQMTKKSCDAIVNVLEKVPLATYINQKNADFIPKAQEGGTCYANAIAAVFHLAMHRIVGREGGVPDFKFFQIRKRIIDEYGVKGANTKSVLAKVSAEYRLHFSDVDEKGARQAINRRRPVVARFGLYKHQWEKFEKFYETTPKGILKRSDVAGEFHCYSFLQTSIAFPTVFGEQYWARRCSDYTPKT